MLVFNFAVAVQSPDGSKPHDHLRVNTTAAQLPQPERGPGPLCIVRSVRRSWNRPACPEGLPSRPNPGRMEEGRGVYLELCSPQKHNVLGDEIQGKSSHLHHSCFLSTYG